MAPYGGIPRAVGPAAVRAPDAAGGSFLDARTAFSGHDVCGGSAWLNGTTLPITDSYHPNRSGYARGYLPLPRGTAT